MAGRKKHPEKDEQYWKQKRAEYARAWRKRNPDYHTKYMRKYRALDGPQKDDQ